MKLKDFFVTLLPPFLWGGIIYWFSSQPYQKQDIRPLLGEYDLLWVERWFSWVSFTYSKSVISIESRGLEAFVEFIIRKSAHVFVFFVLALLVFRLLKLLSLKLHWQTILSLIVIVIFAVSDEYRHLLDPNRSGLVEDVMVDIVGGVLGIILGIVLQMKFGKRLKSKKK